MGTLSGRELSKELESQNTSWLAGSLALLFTESGQSFGRQGLMPDFREEIEYPMLQLGLEERAQVIGERIPMVFPVPEKDQISPAGFDFRVGNIVAKSDILKARVTEKELAELRARKLEDGEKYTLIPNEDGGIVYYITSRERVNLPETLEIKVDSKSTTGRVGAMCHNVGRTSAGNIIWAVQCYSFPLIVTAGKTSLAQAAVRLSRSAYMTLDEVRGGAVSLFGDGVDFERALRGEGLDMTFSTKRIYVAKKCDVPIDMDSRGLNWNQYFELRENNGKFVQEPKKLHLLGTCEGISLKNVCGFLSRHDRVHTGTGMWGHFAGMFQPGFSGRITMETYCSHRREIQGGGFGRFCNF